MRKYEGEVIERPRPCYIVLRPITLGYDSTIREPTPKRFKTHREGSRLHLGGESFSGNVWFYDEDGERGKIECGDVEHLVIGGRLRRATVEELEDVKNEPKG